MPVYIDNNKWKLGGEGLGWGALEQIDIDVDDPVKVCSTSMYYKDGLTKFRVATEVKKQDEHVVKYHIHYTEEDNQHLEGDYAWGTHILTLNDSEDSGKSTWIWKPKDGQDREYEGPGWRLEKKLTGEKRRITPTKLQRAQEKFRKKLLEIGGCCALTGETCQDALEAAHIIPVKCGGQESLGNGILLRADLHRIYDRGKFFINPKTGKPERIARDGLSEEYREILNQGKLPEHTLVRVREALHERWPE